MLLLQGQTMLHGHLLIEIRAAQNLPDMEGWVSKLVDKKDVTDPFVDVRLGKAKLAKTSVVLNSLNPEWNESYRIETCHFGDELSFEVRDKDHAYAEFIGSVDIPTGALLNGEIKEGWFPIKKRSGSHKGQLHLRVQFVSKAAVERTYDVPCYFPMQRNCNVTLYQNAHVPPNMPQLANLVGPDGKRWTTRKKTMLLPFGNPHA